MTDPRYIIDPRGQAYRLAYREATRLQLGDIVFDFLYRPGQVTDILDYGFGIVVYCDGFPQRGEYLAGYFEAGEEAVVGEETE